MIFILSGSPDSRLVLHDHPGKQRSAANDYRLRWPKGPRAFPGAGAIAKPRKLQPKAFRMFGLDSTRAARQVESFDTLVPKAPDHELQCIA